MRTPKRPPVSFRRTAEAESDLYRVAVAEAPYVSATAINPITQREVEEELRLLDERKRTPPAPRKGDLFQGRGPVTLPEMEKALGWRAVAKRRS